jgi:hypothetical protein
MPKLIVYVKADTWRRIEAAANGEDAAALARRISVQAIESFLSSGEAAVPSVRSSTPARESASRATSPEDPHFKPDFK